MLQNVRAVHMKRPSFSRKKIKIKNKLTNSQSSCLPRGVNVIISPPLFKVWRCPKNQETFGVQQKNFPRN